MRFRYCPACEKETAHQRALGIGTLLAVLITCGLWLLTLPFYPQRCRVCAAPKYGALDWYDFFPPPKRSLAASAPEPPINPANNELTANDWRTLIGAGVIAIIFLFVLMAAIIQKFFH